MKTSNSLWHSWLPTFSVAETLTEADDENNQKQAQNMFIDALVDIFQMNLFFLFSSFIPGFRSSL